MSECAGELEQAVETTAVEDFSRGCGDVACSAPDVGAGPARGWHSVDAGVGQAGLACLERACPVATWSETSEYIRSGLP